MCAVQTYFVTDPLNHLKTNVRPLYLKDPVRTAQ